MDMQRFRRRGSEDQLVQVPLVQLEDQLWVQLVQALVQLQAQLLVLALALAPLLLAQEQVPRKVPSLARQREVIRLLHPLGQAGQPKLGQLNQA